MALESQISQMRSGETVSATFSNSSISLRGSCGHEFAWFSSNPASHVWLHRNKSSGFFVLCLHWVNSRISTHKIQCRNKTKGASMFETPMSQFYLGWWYKHLGHANFSWWLQKTLDSACHATQVLLDHHSHTNRNHRVDQNQMFAHSTSAK